MGNTDKFITLLKFVSESGTGNMKQTKLIKTKIKSSPIKSKKNRERLKSFCLLV
jgi:hypothetical protein